jgi:hypothetical protein
VALGLLGWQYGAGVYRYVFAIGIPLLAAIFWGIFAVRDDPSRSGNTIVQVPGLVRLFLELTFFVLASWSLFTSGATNFGWIYAVVVIIHYAASYDRVIWLIRH